MCGKSTARFNYRFKYFMHPKKYLFNSLTCVLFFSLSLVSFFPCYYSVLSLVHPETVADRETRGEWVWCYSTNSFANSIEKRIAHHSVSRSKWKVVSNFSNISSWLAYFCWILIHWQSTVLITIARAYTPHSTDTVCFVRIF